MGYTFGKGVLVNYNMPAPTQKFSDGFEALILKYCN
jgi:hypothetical protein